MCLQKTLKKVWIWIFLVVEPILYMYAPTRTYLYTPLRLFTQYLFWLNLFAKVLYQIGILDNHERLQKYQINNQKCVNINVQYTQFSKRYA